MASKGKKKKKSAKPRKVVAPVCFYRGKLSSNAIWFTDRLRGELARNEGEMKARLSLMALEDAVGKLVAISGKKEKKALQDTLKTVEDLGSTILSKDTSTAAKVSAANQLDRTVENLEYFVADSCASSPAPAK